MYTYDARTLVESIDDARREGESRSDALLRLMTEPPPPPDTPLWVGPQQFEEYVAEGIIDKRGRVL